MKIQLFLTAFFLLTGLSMVSAQTSDPRTFKAQLATADGPGGSRVNIQEPSDLETMLNRDNISNDLVKVFRVQIFFDNRQDARARAFDAKNRFSTYFPDISAHVGYRNPNFNVMIGDYYLTKEDAIIVLARVREYFKDAVILESTVKMNDLIAAYVTPMTDEISEHGN